MSIQAKKERCESVSVIHERIKQEEIIKYESDYCEVNYYEYEHKQNVSCIECYKAIEYNEAEKFFFVKQLSIKRLKI